MATQKIRYDIEAAVSGNSEVNALAASLEGLAGTLEDDLKTQALASAAALRQLGEKQGAIDTFRRLKGEVEGAAGSLREAQTAAQQLGQKLAASEAPTRAQAGQLQKLRDSVRAAKTELQQKTVALDQSRGALRSYGVGTDQLAQSERNVRAAIAASAAEVRQLIPAYPQAGQAAAASGRQQAQAATEARQGLSGLGEQLRNIQGLAIGALGGSFVGSLVGDVARTADAFSNLSARIRLATEGNEGFEQGMADVQRIAQTTNTDLGATAGLYATLTRTSRDAGLTARAAQEEAAGLTEVINQSIQLSGASSQAAQAAVTQLIQGLQSGVLRGEEFNSVVEQSPRLARALADGLGVTIGQLRAMAQQGQLTADVIRGALGGQAQAIQREFDQLPPTIGRAVQSLSNAWTIYVGEADKATGASAAVAGAINTLATNLDEIAAVATRAGAVLVAVLAVQAAGAVRAFAVEALAAKTATGLLALEMSKVPTALKITVAAVGFEVGFQIGEMLRENSALARQLGVGVVGFFQQIVNDLRFLKEAAEAIFTSDTMDAAFDRYVERNKAIGEIISTMMDDAKEAPKAVEQAATGAVSATDKLGTAATQAGTALQGAAGQADSLGAKAAAAGAAGAAGLGEIKPAAETAALAAEALGVDLVAAGTRVGQAFEVSQQNLDTLIAGLPELKATGVDVGNVVGQALTSMINAAKNGAELEELRKRVEGLRGQLGEKLADGLLTDLQKQAEKLDVTLANLPVKAKTHAEKVADAFRDSGIKTQAELTKLAQDAEERFNLISTSGQTSAAGVTQAWRQMAEASIAANGGVASEALKAEAAMQGLEIAVDSTGRAIIKNMDAGKTAVDGFAKGVADAAAQVRRLQELQGLAGAGGDLSGVGTDELQKAQADLLKSGGALSSPEYIKLRNELMNRRKPSVDKDGMSLDSSGKRLTMGSDLATLTGIKNFLNQAGLNDEQAKAIALEFADSQGNIPYINNPGQIKYGGRSSTMSMALLKAAERTTFAPTTPTTPGQPGTPAPGGERTVNVRLIDTRGNTRVVQTNDAGAASLLETLRSASLVAGG